MIWLQLTDSIFDENIKNQGCCLVMFWGSWCPVCKQFQPYLQVLQNTFDVPVFSLNIDQNKQSMARYHIRGTPSFLFFRDGVEVDRLVGAVTQKQLHCLLEEQG